MFEPYFDFILNSWLQSLPLSHTLSASLIFNHWFSKDLETRSLGDFILRNLQCPPGVGGGGTPIYEIEIEGPHPVSFLPLLSLCFRCDP